MSARFRRRGEIVEAVQFDGTNAEECARCAGDESGNHLEFEFRVGWWYLRMDTRATVLTDKTFSLLFEPVPLPEPAPADGWTAVGPKLLRALQHMHWCRGCAEGPWEDCEEGRAAQKAMAEADALPSPPVVEGKP